MPSNLSDDAKHQIDQWQRPPFDQRTIEAVKKMVANDPKALHACFYTRLAFGTGGLRGLMGVGTNRMNLYTVAAATKGLGNYLNARYSSQKSKVFISYDGRNQSKTFGHTAARILAALGIQVFITPEPRPTPFVSFGLRYHGCHAGIMVTASHNPPEYNGFKVYGRDGAQCTSPEDKAIIDAVNAIDDLSLPEMSEENDPLIHRTTKVDEEAYFAAIEPLKMHPSQDVKEGKKLGVIYSSLHGVGHTLMEEGMQRWGFSNFHLVKKQSVLDGNFTHAPDPNPEKSSALTMGQEMMLEKEADIFIANDPDADRMGVCVRHEDQSVILTGNQIAVILAYSLLESHQKKGDLTGDDALVTTIVSTPMLSSIAEHFAVQCHRTLTGFKYIGEKIKQWEESGKTRFIFGAEESLGYLVGTHSRDKDGIVAALSICEVALNLKLKGKTLVDLLFSLYARFGLFFEDQISINFPSTAEGLSAMQKAMKALRASPLKSIKGSDVIERYDYLEGKMTHLETGQQSPLELPSSNVLCFVTRDKSRYYIRPSGTEPKVKIYAMLQRGTKNPSFQDLMALKKTTHRCLNALKAQLEDFSR